jgi:hypothetical protein
MSLHCRVCGAPLREDALFCGECGSSVTATLLRRADVVDDRSSDTTLVEPLPRPARAGTWSGSDFEGARPAVETGSGADVVPWWLDDAPRNDAPGSDAPGNDALENGDDVFEDGNDASESGNAAPDNGDRAPDHSGGDVEVTDEDAESSSPPVPNGSTVSFVVAFSSGGIETIAGPVLLGRRPAEQPGETGFRLVAIADPGRSVSKTHLEFGIEGENLWVCDRFSANGTVLRPPGGRARLCEPGRRYRVGHGTRIEIGEQYIDVG